MSLAVNAPLKGYGHSIIYEAAYCLKVEQRGETRTARTPAEVAEAELTFYVPEQLHFHLRAFEDRFIHEVGFDARIRAIQNLRRFLVALEFEGVIASDYGGVLSPPDPRESQEEMAVRMKREFIGYLEDFITVVASIPVSPSLV